MLRIKNIKTDINDTNIKLEQQIKKKLKSNQVVILSYKIVKKSLDSRKKQELKYIYTIDVEVLKEEQYLNIVDVDLAVDYDYKSIKVVNNGVRPVIVGSGPAGLLSAIILAEANLKPIVIEMGKDVDARIKDINDFWQKGILNETSNVQFGAGGAGTFSDGKLTTGVKNPLRHKLIDELIEAGAPKEIKYESMAHIGTDILCEVVKNLCNKIVKLGGEIRFETKMIGIIQEDREIRGIKVENINRTSIIKCENVILAIGHSARDTFYMLHSENILMEAKPFSVGVRIEHMQKKVNACQYGSRANELGAASYKTSIHLPDKRGVYTFCMCPGGVVVGAASEKNQVVTNGMSYNSRNLTNSNSAILVSVLPIDYGGDIDPLAGIAFQRTLEAKAFKLGGSNYYAPVQLVEDFLLGQKTIELGEIKPSYLPGVTLSNLAEIFPEYITRALQMAIKEFSKKLSFFDEKQAVLTGVESRSSSPITIIRDKSCEANISGLYPCGEGAGYAGGIVSAGIDGIRCAESILLKMKEEYEKENI